MNPALIWAVAKYAAIAVALYFCYQFVDNNWATDAGIAAGVKRQKVETDRVQAEYTKFVNDQAALGIEQDKRTAAANAANKSDKEKKDAKIIELRAALSVADGELRRAREERARVGFLPRPSAGSKNPDRAEVKRAEFESAMGILDARGAGIAAQGDDYRLGLDSLKK